MAESLWQVQFWANDTVDTAPDWEGYFATEALADAAEKVLREAGLGAGPDETIRIYEIKVSDALPQVVVWYQVTLLTSADRLAVRSTLPGFAHRRISYDPADRLVPTEEVEIEETDKAVMFKGLSAEKVEAAYCARRDGLIAAASAPDAARN